MKVKESNWYSLSFFFKRGGGLTSSSLNLMPCLLRNLDPAESEDDPEHYDLRLSFLYAVDLSIKDYTFLSSTVPSVLSIAAIKPS